MLITRPKFVNVPLATGLQWKGGGGWRYEEKLDGVWTVREMGRSVICGELLTTGVFIAFDIPILDGCDIRKAPLRERMDCLNRLSFQRPAVGHGAEFLEAVLSRGGEGVVVKELDAPFGAEWFKCKRIATFDLLVTEKNTKGPASIRLSELNGEDRGWCPCRAAYDSVRVGDIAEVAAYGLTAKGKLREPRFIKLRPDKCK